jgi:hypothetical protein
MNAATASAASVFAGVMIGGPASCAMRLALKNAAMIIFFPVSEDG